MVESTASKYFTSYAEVAVGDTELPIWQRSPEDKARLAKIRGQGSWNERYAQTPDLIQREDGTYIIVDGGGRFFKASEAFGPGYKLMCRIHHNVGTVYDELDIFTVVNKSRQPVSPAQLFLSLLKVGNPEEVEINEIVGEFHMKVGLVTTEGTISAVGRLVQAYKQNESDGVRDLLTVMTTAYGHLGAANNGQVMGAVNWVLLRHPEANLERLAAQLEGLGTPRNFISSVKLVSNGTSSPKLGTKLVAMYNLGIRGSGYKALPKRKPRVVAAS